MKRDLFSIPADDRPPNPAESDDANFEQAKRIYHALPDQARTFRLPESIHSICEGLHDKLQALVDSVRERAFIKHCASSLARNLYRDQPGYHTPGIVLAGADLAARAIVEQWTQAPLHHISQLTQEQREGLLDDFFESPAPSLSASLLKISSAKNLFIAAASTDSYETYIRRAQIIVAKVNPLYVVLDSEVVGLHLQTESGTKEVCSSLGVGAFYLSCATKIGARKATPIALAGVTGAAGAVMINSDGSLIGDRADREADKAARPPSSRILKKLNNIEDAPSAEQISTPNRIEAKSSPPNTQAQPTSPAGGQMKQFAEIRRRQDRRP